MNPRSNTTCVSSDGPGFSTTSGSDIKGYIINVYKHIEGRKFGHPHGMMRYYQLNGRVVETSAEATQLGLLYGVLHYYGRNTCRFVMSRAARKRGIKTRDIQRHLLQVRPFLGASEGDGAPVVDVQSGRTNLKEPSNEV